MLINVVVDGDGSIPPVTGEVQIHLLPILKAKEEIFHKLYEIVRDATGGALLESAGNIDAARAAALATAKADTYREPELRVDEIYEVNPSEPRVPPQPAAATIMSTVARMGSLNLSTRTLNAAANAPDVEASDLDFTATNPIHDAPGNSPAPGTPKPANAASGERTARRLTHLL